MNLTFPQFWNLLSLYSWFNNSNKKLIYRRDSARCECRNPRPCLSIIYPSAVYNLHPLNSHTHYLVIYLFISICVKNASPSLHIHTTSLFQMDGKRRLGSGGHASVSGCPEHWTIQSWTQIRTKLHRMITMHARPRQTDGRTDRRGDIMAIAQRFVLWTHRALIMPTAICHRHH